MGIVTNGTVADCLRHRRRHHRVQTFNRIEVEIEKFKRNWVQENDIPLWRNEKGKYKKVFSTKETWLCIREKHLPCHWFQAVWFKHATPKFSFITWLAMRGRLQQGRGCKNGMVMLMLLVFYVKNRWRLKATYFLSVLTQHKFGRHS